MTHVAGDAFTHLQLVSLPSVVPAGGDGGPSAYMPARYAVLLRLSKNAQKTFEQMSANNQGQFVVITIKGMPAITMILASNRGIKTDAITLKVFLKPGDPEQAQLQFAKARAFYDQVKGT